MEKKTREEWQEEFEKVRKMDVPDQKKVRLLYDLKRAMQEQIIEEEGSDALGYIPDKSIILNLPVEGMGITYRELCEREHLDWLTGEPIVA